MSIAARCSFSDIVRRFDEGNGDIDVSHVERLTFWPFRHRMLDADLGAAGLSMEALTYGRDVEHDIVTARGARTEMNERRPGSASI